MTADPFTDLPKHHFRAILADPPWSFRTWSKTRQTRAAANHYAVMGADDIEPLPIGELAADDCALFMWATSPMLPQALAVMAAWGFTFKTVAFYWAKTTPKTDSSWAPKWHCGLGYWTRANAELCLLGTRGKPKRLSKSVRQLIVAPRREHSRKPDEIHDRIERLVAGPYLELFARQKTSGWLAWGIEVSKFDPRRRIKAPCFDCGDDTAGGDWYMVHDHVWTAAWPNTKQANGRAVLFKTVPFSEILCLRCLEQRLGRALTPADFTAAPVNDDIVRGMR
jgi:N6-adenosine-specific RNA methylase IME4